jgi:hypothetical protein
MNVWQIIGLMLFCWACMAVVLVVPALILSGRRARQEEAIADAKQALEPEWTVSDELGYRDAVAEFRKR